MCYSRLRIAVRNRGCLECEEASVLLASYPKEEAAEAQSLGETASTSIYRSPLWTSFRAMESAAADKPRFVYFERFFQLPKSRFTKTLWRAPVSPFLSVQRSGEARACSHEAAVPVAQALREERSTDVLVDSGRNSSSPRKFPPFVSGSREGPRAAARWHTPHQHAPCASE